MKTMLKIRKKTRTFFESFGSFILLLLTLSLAGCGGDNPAASPQAAALTPNFVSVKANVESALAKIQSRKLNSRDNTPWVIAAALFALGKDLEVTVAETGMSMKAYEYLCKEARYQNQRIFRTLNGQPALPTRGLTFGLTDSFKIQDHVDQYLSVFAEIGVATDQSIVSDDGVTYTVANMVEASTRNFTPSQELGWTLISLSVYGDAVKPFITDANETFTLENVIALANRRDLQNESRWGTHQLYAMGFALRRHLISGGRLDGSWAEARAFLDRYIALAKRYQQSDGAFSADMFWGSSAPDSHDLLMETTGHMLMWLNMALTTNELREPWILSAIDRLSREVLTTDFSVIGDSAIYMTGHALKQFDTLMSMQ
ncbi:MAG: hypothetical protein HQM09_19955 [Candidatus Riflebacteria bacterium]|nr:hypothetical protein [Candidatus Riflebacteria bacterium]